VGANESTHPLWNRFRWWFWRRQWLIFIDCFKVIRGGCVDESTRHLWKLFHWWFPSRHRLSFRWRFLSQQWPRALLNPRVTFWEVSRWWFLSRQWRSFSWLFLSQLGLWALTCPHVTYVIGFVDDFKDDSGSVFIKSFCQQGVGVLTNPRVTFGSCFVDDFPVGTDFVFVDFFSLNKCCECWWIHASPMEAVSVMISESAAAQFLLTISESKGAVCSHESRRHLWKVFRWWFLSRHRLHFCWPYLSQQGLRALSNPCVTF